MQHVRNPTGEAGIARASGPDASHRIGSSGYVYRSAGMAAFPVLVLHLDWSGQVVTLLAIACCLLGGISLAWLANKRSSTEAAATFLGPIPGRCLRLLASTPRLGRVYSRITLFAAGIILWQRPSYCAAGRYRDHRTQAERHRSADRTCGCPGRGSGAEGTPSAAGRIARSSA